MDSLHHSRKIPKMKSFNNAPINTQLNMDSTLIRYLRGRSPMPSPGTDSLSSPAGRSFSPLSMVENVKSPPPMFGPPVKVVDDDVLVMDGILVESLRGGRVSKSPLMSNSGGGSSSNSSSDNPHNTYKTELCRSWEDFGHCRYGSKCQFAHGKEELCPTNFLVKNKSEVQSYRSNTDRLYTYSPKSCFLSPVMTQATLAGSKTAFCTTPEHNSRSPVVTIKSIYPSKNSTATPATEQLGRVPDFPTPQFSKKSTSGNIKPDGCRTFIVPITTLDNWSPQDDGIEVSLPFQTDRCPSREDVDVYINSILYGPTRRKRLSVFTMICPE